MAGWLAAWWALVPVAWGTPSAAPPKRESSAGAMVTALSGRPLPACACGNKAGARLARCGRWVGDAGSRFTPGTTPCGIGVPGTPGPMPAGLTRGEPAGAKLVGTCTPGVNDGSAEMPAGGVPGTPLAERAPADDEASPGSAANSSLAIRASVAGSGRPGGSVGWGMEIDTWVFLPRVDYL